MAIIIWPSIIITKPFISQRCVRGVNKVPFTTAVSPSIPKREKSWAVLSSLSSSFLKEVVNELWGHHTVGCLKFPASFWVRSAGERQNWPAEKRVNKPFGSAG